MLVTGVRRWGDREAVLLWMGLGTFVAVGAILLGAVAFRARPLRRSTTGAGVLVMGAASLAVLLGREAVHVTGRGEGWVQALSVVLTVVLPFVGVGLMIDRPKLSTERAEEPKAEADGSRGRHPKDHREG